METSAFGTVLKEYRLAISLTREELAERANLSARAFSDLERGVRRVPQKETIALLATALGLTGSRRESFAAVVRGRPGLPPPPGGDRGQDHTRLLPFPLTPRAAATANLARVTHDDREK